MQQAIDIEPARPDHALMDIINNLIVNAVLVLMQITGTPQLTCIPEASTVNTDQLINDILRREGGYVDHPADPGGATNFGITQRSWDAYRHPLMIESVADLTAHAARDFYRREYIAPLNWITNDGLTALIVDSSINHGENRVARWMQAAAEVEVDGRVGPLTKRAVNNDPALVYREVLRTRFKFYAQIATDQLDLPGGDPQAVFLRGWTARACEFIV